MRAFFSERFFVLRFFPQRDETSLLAHAALDHIPVQRPFQLLIGYGDDVEAGLA